MATSKVEVAGLGEPHLAPVILHSVRMLPKVIACMNAIEGGVGKAHIVDGRIPHCLLLEIFTREGIGTELTR